MPKKHKRAEQKQIEAAIARAKKQDKNKKSAQDSIPFQRMFPDGICRVTDHYYTKTVQFQDINYQLNQNEDKTAIFEGWCDFLNYFDSSVRFQLSFINMAATKDTWSKSINIPRRGNDYDDIAVEYETFLRDQLAKGNNGLIKTKYLTFGIEAETLKAAKPRLERIEIDLLNNFKRLGVAAAPLTGDDRLRIIRDPIGREQKPVFINESGLYSLILSSRMPLAKQFKRWVTAEVLPSIRKYGAYMMPSLLEQVKENPQAIYGLAEKLLTDKNRADWLQSELSRAKPKADYYDAFVNPRDCTNIRNTANELGIRQCELTEWLVAQRFLYRDYGGQLLPYSPHLRKGLFIERDFVRNGHKGVQTLFTPYGKEMVRQMLMEAGYLPLY